MKPSLSGIIGAVVIFSILIGVLIAAGMHLYLIGTVITDALASLCFAAGLLLFVDMVYNLYVLKNMGCFNTTRKT